MTGRTLRVAVLTPQLVVAEGLRAILATMRGGVDFVPFCRAEPDPDVVLYDAIGLVCGDRTDLRMLVDKTTACLFVVSRELRPSLAALAHAAGADGHFCLGADAAQILEAIERAVTEAAPVGAERDLSGREAEVLRLVGQGWSNSEIVEDLQLDATTVKAHIRTAYRKIGARNRSQAARWALTHELV